MYILVDETDHITAASTEYHCGESEIEVAEPSDFSQYRVDDWAYQDGELIYAPINRTVPAPEPSPQEQTDTLMLDHEERLIYLELGVNDNAVSGS